MMQNIRKTRVAEKDEDGGKQILKKLKARIQDNLRMKEDKAKKKTSKKSSSMEIISKDDTVTSDDAIQDKVRPEARLSQIDE